MNNENKFIHTITNYIMKSYQSSTHPVFTSIRQFNIPSDTNIIDAEFNPENQSTSKVINLYYKHEDEPDFDCEFLPGINSGYSEDENSIDFDSEEEDHIDEYHDDQWDMDIYDPYLESTYF